VSLAIPGHAPIFFDLGTGLRYFGRTQPHDGSFHGTCLLSHLHWDHTQGLPFFVPILREGSTLDIYAPIQEDGRSVESAIRTFMQPPHFPISLERIPGRVRFHDIGDAEFEVGPASVMSRLIPHVGNTLGYRVTVNGVSVAYLSDHQMPYDGAFTLSDGARELMEGVDLLIHDAQYTTAEFEVKRTWGHCTVDYAVWAAAEVGASELALFHHDPIRHDDAVDELERCAQAASRRGLRVFAAAEGMTVELSVR
jgi:phosphoribosyl 1,2-cyclic phosphodiesterase